MSRRVVVRTALGMDGIIGIISDTDVAPDTIASEGILYRLFHVDERSVRYEEQPTPQLPEAWQPLVDATL